MAYGQNLAKEIESLVMRQDYSECRYRGLLKLIDDCENHLSSLNNHENRCAKEKTALKRLLKPSESNPSKRLRVSNEQGKLANLIDPHRAINKNTKMFAAFTEIRLSLAINRFTGYEW